MEYKDMAKTLPHVYASFPEFVRVVLPLSFAEGQFIHAEHIEAWARTMQTNPRTVRLAPRGHLKSTTLYAYTMWRIMRTQEMNDSWMYISYNQLLSAYHIRKIKDLVQRNPYFAEIKELTDADSALKYSWDGNVIFEMQPAGILAFKRGWHGNVICDDILADPDNLLNQTMINKVNRIFFDDVLQLPNPDQCLHVAGTPQHSEDLFYQIRERKELMKFKWEKDQAIVNELEKKTLWPERYPYEYLDNKRKSNPRTFAKEYMCEPVWASDSFLGAEKVLLCVNKGLKCWNLSDANTDKIGTRTVVGGWDLGKKLHPSHFAVFMEDNKKLVQIYDKWMDRWDYQDQLELVQQAIKSLRIDRILYDATRGELDAMKEQHLIPPELEPIILTSKEQHAIATQLEGAVNGAEIELLNVQRTISELLKVNGELDAIDSDTGHGDSFWSIGLAVKAWRKATIGNFVPLTGLDETRNITKTPNPLNWEPRF